MFFHSDGRINEVGKVSKVNTICRIAESVETNKPNSWGNF